jgi:hypothetical protein
MRHNHVPIFQHISAVSFMRFLSLGMIELPMAGGNRAILG